MISKIEVYTSGGSLRTTLTGDDLFNGVTYSKSINASKDLQLGQVASAQVTFTTTYSSVAKTDYFKYYTWQECDANYRLIGYYYVDNINKDVNFYTITGYDCICKLDQDISDWLKNTCTATNITQLFTQICNKCGVGIGTSSFLTNTYMPIDPKELYSNGITARSIMGYIAEATASYVYTRDDNLIHCYTYTWASSSTTHTPTKTTLTADDYSYLNMAKEQAPAVTNIAVNSVNGTYQTNPNASSATMSFIYNPCFYKKNDYALNSYVPGVKSIVANIGSYYPCKFKCFSDYKLQTGDIIYVNDGVSNKKVLIMSMQITDSGCEFQCFGQAQREPFVQQNTDRITNLEGTKFNIDEWASDSTAKQFNSAIAVDDVLIANGLGYEGHLNNNSLIAVIQYILTKIGDVNINMSGNSYALNHTYDTIYNNAYTATVSSGAGVSCALNNGVYRITCNNSSTSYPNDGVVTIKQNGSTVKTINCTCYTAVMQVNQPVRFWYPGETDYDKIKSRVYINSISNANKIYDDTSLYPMPEYDSNTYLWRDYSDSEGFQICFKQAGLYYWQCIDTVHEAVNATWKILVN